MGLYNAELKETFSFFMPKELQHENMIKAVLDHQISHDIHTVLRQWETALDLRRC